MYPKLSENNEFNGQNGTRTGRNSAETRLLNGALTLFSKKGYDGTTIREITELAGVTRPVLYYYFKNKEDLFRRIVEAAFAEMHRRIDHTMGNVHGCRDRLKAIARGEFSAVEENPDFVRMVAQVFLSPGESFSIDKEQLGLGRLQHFSKIMQAGLEAGELAGADAQSLALMFTAIVDTHVLHRIGHSDVRLTPSMADRLVDLFLDGAGATGDSRPIVQSGLSFGADSPME